MKVSKLMIVAVAVPMISLSGLANATPDVVPVEGEVKAGVEVQVGAPPAEVQVSKPAAIEGYRSEEAPASAIVSEKDGSKGDIAFDVIQEIPVGKEMEVETDTRAVPFRYSPLLVEGNFNICGGLKDGFDVDVVSVVVVNGVKWAKIQYTRKILEKIQNDACPTAISENGGFVFMAAQFLEKD